MTTYAVLCDQVALICENQFTADEYSLFFKNAEQRIYNTVQIANLRKNVTGTITASNQYLQAPTDFLSVYSLAVYPVAGGAYEYLLNKDVNFIRQAYPNPATTGKPKHYAIFGPRSDDVNELSFLIGPTPNVTYNAELHYFYYPESIVTAGDTWLGENFDSALLNGALVEAIRYMKGEPDMVKLYQDMYLQSIALLKNLGDGKQRGDAYRSGQVRIQVN
jgi:hypothetical protein